MDEFFKYITPITYWLLVILWSYIFIFYIRKIKSKDRRNKLFKLLLLILAIDAFRTLFESIYFGAWYTSLSGLIPIEVFTYLAQPQIVFLPKIITLITAVLILVLIINKWLPSEINQKEELNALIERQTSELLETNKKLIEARIKAEENEKKFKVLYNNSPDMYVSVSPKDALIQLCNETLIQKTGYSRDEIIGSPIFKMYHEDCMDDVKKAFELFVETGEVKDQELLLKRKDGSKIEVSLNVNAIRSEKGEIIQSMSSWRDITDRKRAENEIRYNQYLLSKAQEIGSIGTWNLDLITNVLIWTEENYKIFNIPFGTKMNYELFLNCIHPEDRDYVQEQWSAALQNKSYDIEHRILINGTVKWVREKAEIEFDLNGKPFKAIGFTQDITLQKLTEVELKKHRDHLEELVKDRTDVIVKQKIEVEEANRLKSEFLSNMSHELRTPLNSIMALSNVLITHAKNKLDDDENNYLQVIERNGKRLLVLINSILDLSKIEAGKMDVSHEFTSIGNLLLIIKENMQTIADKKELVLTLSIPDNLPQIDTDESKLHQVLLNMVSNAIKFTEEGEVSISANYDTNNVFIEIKDTGIGISKEMLPNIFDEFRQVDGTSTRQYEGTGLGLAIANKLVKLLSGNIEVKSELNEGSVFTITIPIKWK